MFSPVVLTNLVFTIEVEERTSTWGGSKQICLRADGVNVGLFVTARGRRIGPWEDRMNWNEQINNICYEIVFIFVLIKND